jgi:hypothetical protein
LTVPRFLLGVVLLAIALVPVAGGAWAVGGRVLGWRGVPARLVEVVLALSTLVVVAEALGVIGLFRVAPIVAGLALAGAGEWWWARRSWPGSPPGRSAPGGSDTEIDDEVPTTQMGRWGAVLSAVVVGVLMADWAPRVVDAYQFGMPTIDTLWYHLPMVTRWVQTGTVGRVQYFDSDAITAFYPGNSELVHGLGLLTTGGDLLSPAVDVVWLILALVAGWCIGRRYRLAPLTLAGTALVFATPGLVGTQPGGAYSDVVTMALLLTSFAILVEAHRHEAPTLAAYGVAALAAGWAVGAKFTMLAPVGAMTIGVIAIAPRAQRWRRTGVWLLGLIVTGAFWYVRNVVAVGNPLPSLGLKLGPLDFKNLTDEGPYINSVSHEVFKAHIWRAFLIPGLDGSLSWGWWILMVLAGMGMVAVLAVGPTRAHRLLAFVALGSLVGYLFTEQILGPLNHPIYFGVNVRYVAPALLLGLVALPAVAVRWPRWRVPIFVAYLLLLASLQLNPTLWPIHVLSMSFVPAIEGVDSQIGLGIGVLVTVAGVALVLGVIRWPSWRRRWWVAAAVVAVVLVVGGAVLQPSYQRNRFALDRLPLVSYTWARDLHDQRIGVYGASSIIQYPLTGHDLSNHVQFLGVEGSDGSYHQITTCPELRDAVNAGRYQEVYLTTGPSSPQAGWMRKDPAVEPIVGTVGLFRIHGPLDPSACPPA